MNLFKRIKYLFTAGEEVDRLINIEKQKLIEEKIESNKHRISLCFNHRQEQNYSHYSQNNCDYCNALKKIQQLKNRDQNKQYSKMCSNKQDRLKKIAKNTLSLLT